MHYAVGLPCLHFRAGAHPRLGTIALYPFQAWLIPKLQPRIYSLTRDRIRSMRAVADQVGDTVSSFAEIRGQNSAAVLLHAMDARLAKLHSIRYEIFERKYLMNYLNNSL